MALSKAEIILIIEFLKELSDHQGNAGCNDYYLKNTPANMKIAKLANHEDWELQVVDGKILCFDSAIVDHLIKRLQTEL